MKNDAISITIIGYGDYINDFHNLAKVGNIPITEERIKEQVREYLDSLSLLSYFLDSDNTVDGHMYHFYFEFDIEEIDITAGCSEDNTLFVRYAGMN
jgi:hypothetical protein